MGPDAPLGAAALLVGQGVWLAFGSLVGDPRVTPVLAPPDGSLLVGVAAPFVALALLGALAVAVLGFVLTHRLPDALGVLDLAVAGAAFGLLYLQTGDLALGTGVHFGALYAGGVVFATTDPGPAVVTVAGSVPGALGVGGQYGFPRVV